MLLSLLQHFVLRENGALVQDWAYQALPGALFGLADGHFFISHKGGSVNNVLLVLDRVSRRLSACKEGFKGLPVDQTASTYRKFFKV